MVSILTKKKIVLLLQGILILCFFDSNIWAQSSSAIEIEENKSIKQNYLVLELGVNQIRLKDRTFSPIVFGGTAPQLTLGFAQNRADKTLWSTMLNVNYAGIDYQNEYFPSTYILAELKFNYLKKVKNYSKSKLYLGGQFRSVANILDFDGFDSGSWFTAQQLEVIAQYNYQISDKHSLEGQLSYPLVSLVSRPLYNGLDEFVVANSDNIPQILYSRMKLYSINKLFHPSLRINYHYHLAKMILSVEGTYDYIQVNSIQKSYRSQWGTALKFQFQIGNKKNKSNEK